MREIEMPNGARVQPRPKRLKDIMTWATIMVEKLKNIMDPPDPIHADFKIVTPINSELVWFQNRDWGPCEDPPYKIGFYFNDLGALDHCPWVCKFGKNCNQKFPDSTFFCVVYGDPEMRDTDFGLDAVKKWAMNFDHPSLMTYDGKLLEMFDKQ